MPTRKHSAWKWIVGVLIGVTVLYVLSFGPVCWWFSSRIQTHPFVPGYRVAPTIYWPIGLAAKDSELDGLMYKLVSWYATVGSNDDVVLPTDWTGGTDTAIVVGRGTRWKRFPPEDNAP